MAASKDKEWKTEAWPQCRRQRCMHPSVMDARLIELARIRKRSREGSQATDRPAANQRVVWLLVRCILRTFE